MESSPQSTSGDIASDLMIILVTVVQLIFFVYFHRYIAWPTTGPDGSVAWRSLLTDGYSTWLPFPITASILVIVASSIMIVSGSDWFRQVAWIGFPIIRITVVVSLLVIFPFDFSVIPNAAAANIVPKVVTGFLVFMVVFYGASAIVLSIKLISSIIR